MPWINKDMCIGCGVCVNVCPTTAIELRDAGKATIKDDKCIRCGKCHTACPEDAVRHDSERIPQMVAENVAGAAALLRHYQERADREGLIGRLIRYFGMQKKVAEETVAKLEKMQI